MNGMLVNTETGATISITTTIRHDVLPDDRITFVLDSDGSEHVMYRRATDEFEWITDMDEHTYWLYVLH